MKNAWTAIESDGDWHGCNKERYLFFNITCFLILLVFT